MDPARILVVDDDQSSRELLARILTTAGHHVTTLADGREAVAALDAGRRAREKTRGLELAVGQAVAGAFWQGAPLPPSWLTWDGRQQAREIFLIMARAAIEAGRQLRSARREKAA